MNKFKNLSGSTKAIIIAGVVLVVVAIGCVIGVMATGGFNGI